MKRVEGVYDVCPALFNGKLCHLHPHKTSEWFSKVYTVEQYIIKLININVIWVIIYMTPFIQLGGKEVPSSQGLCFCTYLAVSPISDLDWLCKELQPFCVKSLAFG